MNSSSADLQRVGAQRPTHLLTPDGPFNFDDGDIAIKLAEDLGLVLLDWQRWLVRWILATDENGLPACNTVIIVVPRQNGKSAILEALELFWMLVAGVPRVIHTAHEADTAAGHMDRIESLTTEPDIEIGAVRTYKSNGKERTICIDAEKRKMLLQYRTRTKSTKRGASPQRVLLDECQELEPAHLAALVPSMAAQSMNADTAPQMIYAGSAPLEHSDYMHDLLERVQRLRPAKTLLAMWACSPDDDPDDVDNWYRTNPALGILISESWVRDAEHLTLAPEDFAAERLGVPKKRMHTTNEQIPLTVWDLLERAKSTFIPSSARIAADFGDLWYEAGVAGKTPSGKYHVGTLVANADRTTFVTGLVEACKTIGVSEVVLPKGSPGEALAPDLERAGLIVYLMPPHEQAQAFRALLDATKGDAPMLRHRGDLKIRKALEQAAVKPWGDGGQMWSRRSASGDISPLTTITMALGRLCLAPAASEPWFAFS